MADANPQRIVERGEASTLPPAMMLQGTADDNLTPDMADRFAAAYAAAGGRVTLEKFAGAPHAFITREPTSGNARRGIESLQAFLRAQAG